MGEPYDDFTLPAALYYDSISHYEQASIHQENGDQVAAERYSRSALLAAFGFFEAQLNQIAFAYAAAHRDRLGQIETDVLEEKETALDDQGRIVRKDKFYRTESRFSFLVLFLSGQDFNRGGETWQRFCESRELRDIWTHPKPPFYTWSLTPEKVRTAIVSVREMFISLSAMMRCEPPLWLRPIDEVLDGVKRDSPQ